MLSILGKDKKKHIGKQQLGNHLDANAAQRREIEAQETAEGLKQREERIAELKKEQDEKRDAIKEQREKRNIEREEAKTVAQWKKDQEESGREWQQRKEKEADRKATADKLAEKQTEVNRTSENAKQKVLEAENKLKMALADGFRTPDQSGQTQTVKDAKQTLKDAKRALSTENAERTRIGLPSLDVETTPVSKLEQQSYKTLQTLMQKLWVFWQKYIKQTQSSKKHT